MVDMCYEGPMSPFVYHPAWLYFACYYVSDRQGTWGLPVFFPPDFEGVKPERGDIVTLTGRLGYDVDRYGPCTVTTDLEEITPDALAAEQQQFAASCRYRFVVESVKVRDHIDLPPLL